MRRHWYEILLGSRSLSAEQWLDFCQSVARHLPFGQAWSIIVRLDGRTLRYFLQTRTELPTSVQSEGFLLRVVDAPTLTYAPTRGLLWNKWEENLAALFSHLECAGREVQFCEVQLRGGRQGHFLGRADLTYLYHGKATAQRLLCVAPGILLSVNFDQSQNFTYRKIPKFLKLDRTLEVLTESPEQALLELKAFPYLEDKYFLDLSCYDFARHSLVLGSSGSGKSKFIASFIHQLYRLAPECYQVVLIDPHDALREDLADLKRYEIDFRSAEQSIDLFAADSVSINASVELTLGLFQSLLGASYNSQLERVLRYSTYLLNAAGDFNFGSLRRLLLDVEYRNELLTTWQEKLPTSIIQFFATDFSVIKNQHYSEAIAPLVAFIDEMQMVPVFDGAPYTVGLADLLSDSFLSIFSLNRLALGDKVVRTIAGLLMQQLFLYAQQGNTSRHLFIIIDEVAVVENPILARFLAELRKFHVSVVLAGQYFEQIDAKLRAAILANTTNYYLFHLSKADATLITANLDLKPVNASASDDATKLLTGLKERECLVQIGRDGKFYPIFRARTLDQPQVTPVPAKTIPTTILLQNASANVDTEFDFDISGVDALSVMQANTTSRKKLSF